MSQYAKENSREFVIFRNMVRWARRVSYLARGATKWRQRLSILLQELRRTFGRVRPLPAAAASGPSANGRKTYKKNQAAPLSIPYTAPHTHTHTETSFLVCRYLYLPTCLIKHAQRLEPYIAMDNEI